MTDGEREITIGEVYRLQLRQGVQLDAIYAEAKKTNGNVIRHEARLDGLDREVRDLKRRPAGSRPASAEGKPAAAEDDDSAAGITKRDLKVVVAVLVSLEAVLRVGPTVIKFLGALGTS